MLKCPYSEIPLQSQCSDGFPVASSSHQERLHVKCQIRQNHCSTHSFCVAGSLRSKTITRQLKETRPFGVRLADVDDKLLVRSLFDWCLSSSCYLLYSLLLPRPPLKTTTVITTPNGVELSFFLTRYCMACMQTYSMCCGLCLYSLYCSHCPVAIVL